MFGNESLPDDEQVRHLLSTDVFVLHFRTEGFHQPVDIVLVCCVPEILKVQLLVSERACVDEMDHFLQSRTVDVRNEDLP